MTASSPATTPVSRSINSGADCCLSFSAQDLVRWAKGLNHAMVLGRDGLELCWTPVRLNSGATPACTAAEAAVQR
jgi:hypothetical protein